MERQNLALALSAAALAANLATLTVVLRKPTTEFEAKMQWAEQIKRKRAAEDQQAKGPLGHTGAVLCPEPLKAMPLYATPSGCRLDIDKLRAGDRFAADEAMKGAYEFKANVSVVAGTPVRVIGASGEDGLRLLHVRVEGGPHEGKSGYTSDEFVKLD